MCKYIHIIPHLQIINKYYSDWSVRFEPSRVIKPQLVDKYKIQGLVNKCYSKCTNGTVPIVSFFLYVESAKLHLFLHTPKSFAIFLMDSLEYLSAYTILRLPFSLSRHSGG